MGLENNIKKPAGILVRLYQCLFKNPHLERVSLPPVNPLIPYERLEIMYGMRGLANDLNYR